MQVSPNRGPDARPKRIKLVVRRFWPYSGSTESAAADWATALASRGHQVEVITLRWEKRWPREFDFGNFSVWRVDRPGGTPWGAYRYLKQILARILERPTDLVIAFGLGPELAAFDRGLSDQLPLIVRLDEFDLGEGEPQTLNPKILHALKSAAGWLVDGLDSRHRLVKLGLAAERGRLGSLALPRSSVSPRSHRNQNIARRLFTDTHPMLAIGAGQPLVVSASPMLNDAGHADLLRAWGPIASDFPEARLWLLGEGPASGKVWEWVTRHRLMHQVILPGQFDELDEVFQAADLYVHPLQNPGGCRQLLRAMAAGLCPLITRPGNRDLGIMHLREGRLVEPAEPEALGRAIREALETPDQRATLGSAAAEWVAEHCDLDPVLDECLELAGRFNLRDSASTAGSDS